MRIQHNIAALNSHRQLTGNNNAVSKNLEKLSSGYRINRAGDDAAGLAISEKMRAQITGLETAQKNANDGISLIQTAEGALTEVHSMLNRMVELADQAANGTYKDDDRANLQKEMDSLKSEIDRISEGTNFNGINLLDGSMGTGTTGVVVKSAANTAATAGNFTSEVKFSVSGLEAGKTITITTDDPANNSSVKADANGNITLNLAATANQVYTQADIDKLIKDATLPASASGLKITIDKNITIGAVGTGPVTQVAAKAVENAKKAYSTKSTTGGVSVTATSGTAGEDTRNIKWDGTTAGVSVATGGGITLGFETGKSYTASDINAMLSKAGANLTVDFKGSVTGADLATLGDTNALGNGAGLAAGGGLSLQIGDTADSFNQLEVSVGDMSTMSLGLSGVSISTQQGAKDSVAVIKKAIDSVSATRGDLGALQNRLEHTINNLGVTTENMTAAESRIRDVDMAKEMMNYTKNNILVQASQAMLAQANQVPQGVLQLLQ